VLQEPFAAFSTTGRHPPFAYGLTVELVHLRSFNKSLTATHSTESKRSVFLAARSAMTFDLTGGETGEARLLDLLDLLFCLVTRRPHRIHHCRMARTRRQFLNSPTFTAVPSFRLKSMQPSSRRFGHSEFHH
jgi:hypothetical protein